VFLLSRFQGRQVETKQKCFPGIDITVRRLSQTFSYELLLQITNHPDNSSWIVFCDTILWFCTWNYIQKKWSLSVLTLPWSTTKRRIFASGVPNQVSSISM